MARRKTYLYKLVDTFDRDDADLTEEIQSNIEPEYFEKIIEVADIFSNAEFMPEETFEDPVINKLYHRYYEEYDQCSKIEMIEYMVKQEGFSWKPVEFIELNW